MDQLLKIRLLGCPDVSLEDTLVKGFVSRKVEALLFYLACNPHPHQRETLASLLWEETPQKQALANLRQALTSMRKRLSPYIIVTRHTVAFNTDSNYWLDVEELEAQLATHMAASTALTNEAATHLAQVLKLYRGEFLQGFHLRRSLQFSEWVMLQQERVRSKVIQGYEALVEYHLTWGEYATGIEAARRLLEIAPLHETTHRRLMLLLALARQRTAALQQYETCRRVLAEELDTEPEPETTQLYEQIRDRKLGQGRDKTDDPLSALDTFYPSPSRTRFPPRSLHNLPAQLIPLLGREAELARVRERLADPNCRLLTLLGPGGVGKTRLAIQTAREHMTPFQHGVYFIALAGVANPELLSSTIADALPLPTIAPSATHDLRSQLLDYLQDKKLLLVLDNFEHLLPGTDLLIDLLTDAPDIKILVTSQEKLNLRAEWRLSIAGLAYPAADHEEDITSHSAVQLFVQGARRVKDDFALSSESAPHIIRICRLVDGMPLAIELAAAWADTMPCPRIAHEIQCNLDFLSTTMQDVSPRHRSMRAVFDYTWQRLSTTEQRALRRLSVFRGSFAVQTASRITNTAPAVLVALADKLLLTPIPSAHLEAPDRYIMHEVFRQYAAAKLAEFPKEQRETQGLHATHFANLLHRAERGLKSGDPKPALDQISADMDNVRAAWEWAVTQNSIHLLDEALDGLFYFYDIKNRFHEGVAVLERAATVLATEIYDTAHTALLGRIMARQGVYLRRLGLYPEAKELLKRSLGLLRPMGDATELSFALHHLGQLASRQGDYAEARKLLQRGLAMYRGLNNLWGMANCLNVLGMVAESLGEYVEAETLYRECLTLREALGDQRGLALGLNNLGIVLEMLGDYEEARQLYERSLIIFTELGDLWGKALPLSNLGDVSAALGDHDMARAYYMEALRNALEVQAVPKVLVTLVKIAQLYAQCGKNKRALEIVLHALAHPATEQFFREMGERLKEELAVKLPPEVIASAESQAQEQSLAMLVAELLENPDIKPVSNAFSFP